MTNEGRSRRQVGFMILPFFPLDSQVVMEVFMEGESRLFRIYPMMSNSSTRTVHDTNCYCMLKQQFHTVIAVVCK